MPAYCNRCSPSGGRRSTPPWLESKANMNKSGIDYECPILVTGASGFLGAYLLRHLLSRGYTHIRGLKRAGSPDGLVAEFAGQIEWVEGDLLDIFSLEDALQGIKQVYHCAAIVSFDPSDRKKMMMVNEEGTANLVNLALDLNIEKLVHVSSIAALGRTKEGTTIDEQSNWQRSPYNTHYAISKFKGEQEVWRGMAEGLNVVVVNPGIILGSGYWDSGTAKIFQTIAGGYAFYPVGATSLVDVRDVVDYIVRLMESDISRERFILQSEHLSYKDLLSAIAEAIGKKPPYIKVTKLLRGIAWRLAWLQSKISGQKPLLTKETAQNSSRTFYYDNHKSLQHFDFEYIPIRQTIEQTAKQFLVSNGQPMMLPEKTSGQ